MLPIEIAKKIKQVLEDKKGISIQIIRIDQVSTLTDYFVIVTGTSNTHVKSLAEGVEAALREEEILPARVEGYRGNSWILMDYLGVIVHVFLEETRRFYDLESLWKDGEIISR